MKRLREIETRISGLGITVNAKEDGTVVMQQGSNVIEWPIGKDTQMVLDAIVTISASLHRDEDINIRESKEA